MSNLKALTRLSFFIATFFAFSSNGWSSVHTSTHQAFSEKESASIQVLNQGLSQSMILELQEQGYTKDEIAQIAQGFQQEGKVILAQYLNTNIFFWNGIYYRCFQYNYFGQCISFAPIVPNYQPYYQPHYRPYPHYRRHPRFHRRRPHHRPHFRRHRRRHHRNRGHRPHRRRGRRR